MYCGRPLVYGANSFSGDCGSTMWREGGAFPGKRIVKVCDERSRSDRWMLTRLGWNARRQEHPRQLQGGRRALHRHPTQVGWSSARRGAEGYHVVGER
jgi:hypothetical protein